MNPIVKPNDQVLANIMMNYWTNFAKYGDPKWTFRTKEADSTILAFLPHNKAYMNFDYNSYVQRDVFKKRVDSEFLEVFVAVTTNENT
ncbi:hypothetical protein KUTeg_020455 [Tegillarca granosa]|uniref:Carboxylesterase type B domain-containing protein n=1 Tax=Tegillarca granosa TaxID=220873 RepID=A0ABQ9EDY0_TEGGR|nr:hypothetical protein KUTeg_020455 [Tegillarca granosa]